MDARAWLDTVIAQFEQSKDLAERAAAQVADADYFRCRAAGANSLAVLVKHMGGNLRSRWTDFLTSDGEKPDRDRESEFAIEREDRAAIEAIWHDGWRCCLGSLARLEPGDLTRTITIRSEPIPVVPAIHRSLSHADYHTGQIVQLARHWAGDSWRSLSIPRGESDELQAQMRARFEGKR